MELKMDSMGQKNKTTKALMELLLQRCDTNNIYLSYAPHLDTAIPCFVRALPFSASVLLFSDKH